MTQINARLSASGEAEITGSNGRTWNTSYGDLEAARQSVQETAAATAAAIDAPVQLVISDPAGERRMLVFANGDSQAEGAHAAAPELRGPGLRTPDLGGVDLRAPHAAAPGPGVPGVGSEEPAGLSLRRRRRPTAADFAASRPAAPRSPAQEGWQGAVNSVSGGALRLAPGAREVARREWRASAQRGLPGHKTVVFVNLKGGASKTTACYLAAATLGRVRGGNVLAWDNNENKGTLGDRAMPASHDHTAIDLLANVDRFATPSNAHELVNYVRAQGENKFHVLASQNQAGDKEVIDGAAFVQLHSVLRQFYHLALVDTGNASTAGTWQAAVEIADEIVLVAMNKEDSSKTLAATVDTLVEMGFADKLARGVLLVTQPPVPSKNRKHRLAANEERLNRIREHFGHYVRKIVIAPYDEALDDGADIIFENLSPATQEAYLEATAAIVDGL
ncbi:chromosome partitioning protein [Sinomonas sp. JGH33]|uniref:Chromosome partitioning protein n=1 Tax=Sinomonas terricola TaxID=3110330 RepID=A0ABU5T8E6_9MICC|nr:chromosome partitioning protein [Sinomonas sp. JGH33]MEA5455711.1 chromosome partitioning protein [Sinomonas sp. JGH33]